VLFVIWMVVFWAFGIAQERFLTEGNLRNMLEENAIVFIVAIAVTMTSSWRASTCPPAGCSPWSAHPDARQPRRARSGRDPGPPSQRRVSWPGCSTACRSAWVG
jgi:hypothetical protein